MMFKERKFKARIKPTLDNPPSLYLPSTPEKCTQEYLRVLHFHIDYRHECLLVEYTENSSMVVFIRLAPSNQERVVLET